MSNMHLILCAVDFSEASRHALVLAIDLAARLGAEVHVIHVYQLPASAFAEGVLESPADLEAVFEERLDKRLREFVGAVPDQGVRITTAVWEGVPCERIGQAADQAHADLIVMGPHGRTGIAHLLLGGVTERLLRSAHVPVVAVGPG